MSDWELEILTSESDSEIVHPSISWRYTGEIIHQCVIPSESPGFTITAIPKLEEFMIETKSFSISDSEVDEYDLPIKWNTGSGRSSKESTTDSRGNQYYSEWESKMFIVSESKLAEVVKSITNHYVKHISSKSYEQITELAYGIGSKNSSNLRAEFPQLQDLLDASKQELKEVYGIGDESGDNLYEIIQNRRLD